MTDRPNVHMRLAAIKLFLRHGCSLPLLVIPKGNLLVVIPEGDPRPSLLCWLSFPSGKRVPG
jgi:hypothetical protein